MKNARHWILLIACLLIVPATFAAVPPVGPTTQPAADDTEPAEEPVLRIVVTIRPLELAILELMTPDVLGRIRLDRLVPDETDPANYRPDDVAADLLQKADIVVADGGRVDRWVLGKFPRTAKFISLSALHAHRDGPDHRLTTNEDYRWLDPRVMTYFGSAFPREIAVKLRGTPFYAELMPDLKMMSSSFKEALDSIDLEFAREVAPRLSQKTILAINGGVASLARRYGGARVINLSQPAGRLAARAALDTGAIPVAFMLPGFDIAKIDGEIDALNVPRVTLDPFGAEAETFVSMMSAIRTELANAIR